MAKRKVYATIQAAESENRRIDHDCNRILKALASRRTRADFVVLGTEWVTGRLHSQVNALRRVQKRNARLVNRLKPIRKRQVVAHEEVRSFFKSVSEAIRNIDEINYYTDCYA